MINIVILHTYVDHGPSYFGMKLKEKRNHVKNFIPPIVIYMLLCVSLEYKWSWVLLRPYIIILSYIILLPQSKVFWIKALISHPFQSLFDSSTSIDIHYDLVSPGIYICSPAIPPLYSDNFDFQCHDDLMHGLLDNEEILGNTMYGHIISDQYCADVSSPFAYDFIR